MGLKILLILGPLIVAAGCGVETITPSAPTATPDSAATPAPVVSTPTVRSSEADRLSRLRERMVTTQIENRGVQDPRVLAAMRAVPRHLFVPDRYRRRAYDDTPLPIDEGQTISQPYIVALMTELLDVAPGEKFLEVGTGSGYQAAVLAEMGAEVYSIEIVPVLAERARSVLDALGYESVRTRVEDGYFGWEEHAPFDGIIVTAAPDHVPPPLLKQVKPSGKVIIPVGPPGGVQTLWLIERRNGQWVSLNQGAVRFVPLLGER